MQWPSSISRIKLHSFDFIGLVHIVWEGSMPIAIKAYANADDVLIAWKPDAWSAEWVGFQLERRNEKTSQITQSSPTAFLPSQVLDPLRMSGFHRQCRQSDGASGPITV
jgi:hypothetical protein